ncbi:predicted protein [Haematococcus lacustris]|uniref:Uncharacterized protein n=1 Tax=Haematococcus lacustris TaxID=44745 RepID=A0A6A0A9U7_HAELA|nr:predicted protein [Haematococcus lacustris]
MSLLAMPLLYINLGVEMVYILDQRLRAQEIPPDKGERVLNDVVRKMFDKDCIDKLFVPCELYSTSAVRKCMDALAHSSIMRLSETSMDKLFDLMMMGVKYQIMCSTKLEGILQPGPAEQRGGAGAADVRRAGTRRAAPAAAKPDALLPRPQGQGLAVLAGGHPVNDWAVDPAQPLLPLRRHHHLL